MESEKEIREAYIFLREKNMTIPSETLQFMLDASLEKLQQPLFKVATEDSCEVLVEPKKCYSEKEGDLNKCAGYKVGDCACVLWQEAPSITEDRLELNKLRVRNIELSDELVDARTAYTNKGIEANKQLKEYKEVVGLYITLENTFGLYKALDSEYNVMRINELLSKLNKD